MWAVFELNAVLPRDWTAGSPLARWNARLWLWPVVSAICIAVCAVGAYAALRLAPLNADMLQSFLAAQSMLKGNVLLSGWHLARDNFFFDETIPLAVLEAIFNRHVSVLTGFSVLIYVLIMAVCMIASVRPSRSLLAKSVSLAIVVLLTAILHPGIDLPMLHPGYHGIGIVVSLLCLVLLAGLRRPVWRHRRLTSCGFFILAVAAIGSDPLTILCAFGPALLVLGYDVLASGRAAPPFRLFLLVLACIVVGGCSPQLIAQLGGFRTEPTVSLSFVAASRLSHSVQGVLFGLLQMSGADVFGKNISSLDGLLSALRLAGWLCGVIAVVSWLRNPNRDCVSVLDRMIMTGLVVMTAACLTSDMFERALAAIPAEGVGQGSRYLSPLIVFGTALVARVMPGTVDRLATRRLRQAAAGALVLGAITAVVASLAMASTLLPYPPWAAANPYRDVGRYLLARGLTCGVGEYWNAAPITALSKSRVVVRAVTGDVHGPLGPMLWLSSDGWYTQMTHPMFAIWLTGRESPFNVNADTITATYGKPTRIEDVEGFSIAYLAGSTCGKAHHR